MSQSQLPIVESLAGPVKDQASKADKAKGKTKPTPNTLKRVLLSGPGFQMYQNAAGEDIKILEDMYEGMAFKNALRAVSSNLDKEAVDLAMAKLFLEADRLSDHQAHITESIPGLLLLAAKQAPWVVAAKKDMKPTVAAEVMMCLYEARRIAVKFSRYRQHPIEDYAKETATALAIDEFRNEKPSDEPEEIFADFTDEQRKKMMGKIIRPIIEINKQDPGFLVVPLAQLLLVPFAAAADPAYSRSWTESVFLINESNWGAGEGWGAGVLDFLQDETCELGILTLA
ncbi:uncharacterized protein BDZ83DRAFT_729518 [Colletotrichum acutatum]|uniref:Uncharacterized protein n=1 Tax=Glomerella acutata TaxID=27357 RepID=A0AAD8ULD7_GLOAC|nr:uncharacterized protein BDZ83DRAFT_729518 [Colletotrichum acutatum]KAK1726407.1 hypothetical protein BDZ83DRAFT_729518 [Colletotrichum acutatum]